jgi:uncharacterized protein with FMN-binding domain
MPNVLRTERRGFSPVPKRGAVALVSTVIAVLLLFNFKTADSPSLAGAGSSQVAVGAPGRTLLPGPVAVAPTPRPTPTAAGGTPAGTAPAGATPRPTKTSSGTTSGTFTGDAIRTRYGTVQIAVVMTDGKIVDVQELQMPSDRRLSAQISQEAGPLLRSEVLQAQSANINGVSGASYTSEGYYESLQSALAQVP